MTPRVQSPYKNPAGKKAMRDAKAKSYRLPIIAGLLLIAGLTLLFCGAGLTATLLIVSVLAVLFWFFARKQPATEEQPCSLVSCCHYLGEQQDEKID